MTVTRDIHGTDIPSDSRFDFLSNLANKKYLMRNLSTILVSIQYLVNTLYGLI